jgi:hypothetical protein
MFITELLLYPLFLLVYQLLVQLHTPELVLFVSVLLFAELCPVFDPVLAFW